MNKLRDFGGSLDRYNKKGGIFIGINPMISRGSKDEHVTKYRHVLVEFDHIPTLEEQWHLINEAKLPCTAVISSGNKSLHAWVRVDAKNRAEFDQRMKMLCDHLEDHIDSAKLRTHFRGRAKCPASFFVPKWKDEPASPPGSFGGKKHRDTEYTEDQAISSALLLVILVFSWSKPNHGLAGSALHIRFNSNPLDQAQVRDGCPSGNRAETQGSRIKFNLRSFFKVLP